MNNFEQMLYSENKNVKLFASTVKSFAGSRGSYIRLICNINSADEESFEEFKAIIERQDFKDEVDVLMFLEG